MAKQKLCVIYGEFHKFLFQQLTPHEQFLQACECGHMTLAPLTRHARMAMDDAKFDKFDSTQVERSEPQRSVGSIGGVTY